VSLKERITDDMKAAMRAGEKERLGVIRMITSAIKQREVDERIVLDDTQVLSVLEKMIKQRKESLAQFQAGNRQDLADKEKAELAIIETYMPAQVDEATLVAAIDQVMAALGANSPKQMGAVMGKVMAQFKGQAVDGKQVQKLVTERLNAATGA